MPYAVEFAAVAEQAIASMTVRGSPREPRTHTVRLLAAVTAHGLRPLGRPMLRYPAGTDRDAVTEFEVAVAVARGPDGGVPDRIGPARGELVPAHYALTVIHTGPDEELAAAHEAIARRLAALGYSSAGPITEITLAGPEDGVALSEHATEIRAPIAR